MNIAGDNIKFESTELVCSHIMKDFERNHFLLNALHFVQVFLHNYFFVKQVHIVRAIKSFRVDKLKVLLELSVRLPLLERFRCLCLRALFRRCCRVLWFPSRYFYFVLLLGLLSLLSLLSFQLLQAFRFYNGCYGSFQLYLVRVNFSSVLL